MAEHSKIQWTDATFNPVRGCVKVSPGCANCYAEALSHTNPGVLGEWGPGGKRVVAAEAYWRLPFKWDKAAAKAGVRRRVFCASLADVFEDHPDWVAPRARLFRTIDSTPHLDWQLLTKRPENVRRFWHGRSYFDADGREWGQSKPCRLEFRRENVWLGTSVEDQARADQRVPELLACRHLAALLFLSCEPLLGPVTLDRVRPPAGGRGGEGDLYGNPGQWLDRVGGVSWVIVGGESGTGARPMAVDWAHSLTLQCAAAGVSCFVKQLGDRPTLYNLPVILHAKKGADPEEWPAVLNVREFPR